MKTIKLQNSVIPVTIALAYYTELKWYTVQVRRHYG